MWCCFIRATHSSICWLEVAETISEVMISDTWVAFEDLSFKITLRV